LAAAAEDQNAVAVVAVAVVEAVEAVEEAVVEAGVVAVDPHPVPLPVLRQPRRVEAAAAVVEAAVAVVEAEVELPS
jgi:hypothetical protein